MSEAGKTAIFWSVAVLLAVLTWARPTVLAPSTEADRGDLFFPEFADPNAARSLEVVEFDQQNGSVRPLKLINRAGRWTLPSHHDYPADAKNRLAQTAAAILVLRRDDVVSDKIADHERCGVLDPLDVTSPSLAGRGTRITIRGETERTLADVIIGKAAEGAQGFRYVRLPGQKRVYLSRVADLNISTSFNDWIEPDLLQVEREAIDSINLRNYSIDERTGRVQQGELLLLEKRTNDRWTLAGMGPGEQVNAAAVNELIANLVGLKIVGVLPKPAGIAETLSQDSSNATITQADRTDLGRKGFYVTPDGRLLSNEGEVLVRTNDGIFYTLRFGEVASGSFDGGSPAAAGVSPEPRKAENRYLFIMVALDRTTPSGMTEAAERRAAALRARFAPWYYVISATSFSTVRSSRSDLLSQAGRIRSDKAVRR